MLKISFDSHVLYTANHGIGSAFDRIMESGLTPSGDITVKKISPDKLLDISLIHNYTLILHPVGTFGIHAESACNWPLLFTVCTGV